MKKRQFENEVNQQNKLDNMDRLRLQMENRVAGQHFNRVVAEYARDDKLNQMLEMQKNKATAVKNNRAEREETLAFELDQVKRAELKKLKERQWLRENCPELRELESKLRAAYIVKETKAQIAEREAIRLENKLKEKQAKATLQVALQCDEEYNKRMMEEEMQKKHQLRKEIQEQLMLNESQRRQEYEEFLKEKKMLDDIIQRVHDEDQREVLKKKADIVRRKQEMEDFKSAQAAWKETTRKELEQEHKDIQKFLQAQALKASKEYVENLAREKAKQKVRDLIAMKVYADRKSKEDRHNIRMELLEQEEHDAIERRNREDNEKLIRSTLDTRDSLLRQMAEKRERERKQAELERQYKEEVIAKISEDARQEQLKCEERRQKLVENRKYIEAMMEERRRQKAERMLKEIRNEECDRLENEAKQKLIDEERINILKEHLPNIIDSIPSCLLKDEDWQKLGFKSVEEMKRAQMK